MIYHETSLADAMLIEIERRGDERGSFARTMCVEEFAAHGLDHHFVQQNTSTSAKAGTLRGLHFQIAPNTEAKLVRCIRGAILDVIVDLRRASPSFLRSEGYELSAANDRLLFVPPGFAHSFITLADDTEVTYLVSAAYAPAAERGLRWNDPRLAIVWPRDITAISDKDANWPLLEDEDARFF